MVNKVVVLTCFLFCSLVVLSGFRQQRNSPGQDLFQKYCVACHGKDGTKGRFGAKNLRTSTLADADLAAIISNGRRWMPSWKKKMNENDLREVAAFVKTLRAK